MPLFMHAVLIAVATVVLQQAQPSIDPAYNPDDPVFLRGRIVSVEWRDPILLQMTVTQAGVTTPWRVQGPANNNTAIRNGWNRQAFQPGADIVVRGYRARDLSCEPACKALARDVSLVTESRTLHPSGDTGAPRAAP